MTANSKTLTLEPWLAQAADQLHESDIASVKLDGELLACFVFSKSRTWLHGHPEHELTVAEQKQLDVLLARRLQHEPIAYILGSKEFYGRDFIVNTDVLVPRPESEDFIEIINSTPGGNLTFIDIGTGSGILAVTTALEKPTWSGTATDISPGALKVAQENAQKLGAKNLVFKKQNLLANGAQNYDIVIANLPYVPNNLRKKPDIAHEPEIALFADNNGLALYQELFQQVAVRKQKPAHILTESLLDQHEDLEKMAGGAGYELVETKGLVQHFSNSR